MTATSLSAIRAAYDRARSDEARAAVLTQLEAAVASGAIDEPLAATAFLGHRAYARGDRRKALTWFEGTLAADAIDLDTLDALRMIGQIRHAEPGGREDALRAYERLVELLPLVDERANGRLTADWLGLEAHTKRAAILLELGRHRDALAAVTAAERHGARGAYVTSLEWVRGNAALDLDDFDGAVVALHRVAERRRAAGRPWVPVLRHLASRARTPEEVVAALGTVDWAAVAPSHEVLATRHTLASAHASLGHPAAAVATWQELLAQLDASKGESGDPRDVRREAQLRRRVLKGLVIAAEARGDHAAAEAHREQLAAASRVR